MKRLTALRLLVALMGLLAWSGPAFAACSNPAGVAGSIIYSSTYNQPAWCDGTNWQSFGGSGSGGTATPAGSTADVQFNSSGALAADTGNFTYAGGLLKAPNISTTAITASGLGTFGTALINGGMTVIGQASVTTVSSTLMQLISNTTTACTAGLAGAQRYNSTSNTIDYCSGSAWLSLGPSATSPISFRALKSGNQTVTVNTITKLSFDTVQFDTNSNFVKCSANCNSGAQTVGQSRFTPTVPGKYLVSVHAQCVDSSTNYCDVFIVKNGTNIASGVALANGWALPAATAIVDMNGTTDYLEANVLNVAGTTINAGQTSTAFQAVLLAPQGGGSGGTATPAGSTGDVQINTSGALDADTGLFYWDKTNHRLGIGTNSPANILTISGTTDANVLSLSNSSPTAYTQAVYYGTGSTWSAGVGNAGETKLGLANKFFIFNTTAHNVALAIDMSGSVGISTSTPAAKLDVNGEVRVGNSGLACGSTVSGAMRYTSGTMQVCDGTAWTNVGIGVPQGTISAFAATSCPSGWSEYTAARGRFLRGIDNGAGNDIDGTRSPGATQGDLIADHKHLQSVGTDNTYIYNYTDGSYVPAFGSVVLSGVARTVGGITTGTSQPVRIGYTSSTIYTTGGGETRPKNVAVIFCQYQGYQSQLATGVATLASLSDVSVAGAVSGSALVYNGSNWTAGSSAATPAGSTNDVQFNNAGALAADSGNFTYASSVLKAPTISATALNSQYGSVTTLYNPGTFSGNTASLNSVSATAISASTVSASMIQVGNNGASCGSGISGAMRYTSGTMQVCDGSNWTNVGIGVPQGTITAFAATSCPSGWSEYTAARGRFLRGIDNGAGNDPAGTRAPGNTQADALQNITGTLTAYGYSGSNPSGVFSAVTNNNAAIAYGTTTNFAARTWTFDASTVARTATETRPVNVAVIFCQYQGYESQLTTGVATLASLSDVSVAGATSGSALVYNGSSWVAGTATGNAQGDRITSGTFSVIANTAGGTVSLSTNGTTWGYLNGFGTSFLPNLQTNSINSGNVSATLVQPGTSSVTCSSGLYGTMRWNATSDTIQICNTAGWTSLSSSSVPNTTLSQGTANYGAIFSGPNTLVTDSALYVDTTNHRIGVGTSTPSTTLDVSGTAGNVMVPGDGSHIYMTRPANNYIKAQSAGGALSFGVNGNDDLSPALFLSAAGKTGINTAAPAATLDVVGTISASDAIQVGSSSLACGSGIAGAMRYTSGTMQVCDGSGWTNIGLGVPQGTIAAFALSSCPNGWSEYTPSRGRFLRGIDNGAGIDPAGTRAPGSTQGDTVGPHNHPITDPGHSHGPVSGATAFFSYQNSGLANVGIGNDANWRNNISTQGSTGKSYTGITVNNNTGTTETRPKNVAVTFCQYQGFQSQLQTGVATLASLSDVSVAGAVNGSTLTYNGSSWVAGSGAASAAGSTGDIQYNNGGAFAADTGRLFWDGTNHRLGIGTNAPSGTLQVQSTYPVLMLADSDAASLAQVGGRLAFTDASGNTASQIGPQSSDNNFVIRNNNGGPISFMIGGSTYGTFASNGNIGLGLGNTSPSYPLSIGGMTSQYPVGLYIAPSGHATSRRADIMLDNWQLLQDMSGNGTKDFGLYNAATSSYPLAVDTNNNVGIGTTTPSDTLDVNGKIRATGYRARTGANGSYGSNFYNLYWTGSVAQLWIDTVNVGNITVSSDRRVKKDIAALQEDSGLAVIEKMTPVSFHWKNPQSGTTLQYGFIAQDMKKVLPDVVRNTGLKTKEAPDGLMRIDYDSLFAPIVKAIQDLKHLFDADHDEVMKLKAANDNLSILVKSQQQQMDALTAANAKLKAGNDDFAHRLDALEKSATRR